MLADNVVEDVPHLGALTLDFALRCLDVLRVVLLNEALHDEGLEELECHLLGQTTLVELQLWADDDDRTAGVVNALTEQVLTEATLLALEHVRDRLQRAVARACNGATTAAVVEERVYRFLQHALFVRDDDVRRTQFKQSLESGVAVDHSTVQVVEVGGREAATVQLNHRAQVRRNNRNLGQDHRCGRVAGRDEGVDDLQALDGTCFTRPGVGRNGLTEGFDFGFKIEGFQALLDGSCAHVALEVGAVAGNHCAVEALVTDQGTDLQVREVFPHDFKTVDVTVEVLTKARHVLLGALAELFAFRGGGTIGFESSEVSFKLLGCLVDGVVTAVFHLLLLNLEFSAQIHEVLVATLFVDFGDHVCGEVNDLFEVLRSEVQHVTEARGHALEVPDVGDRCGQVDVAHALTANLRARDLDATLFTHDALVTDTLVLATRTFPVACGAEDLFTEQAVALRLERAVVDGLRLLDFTV